MKCPKCGYTSFDYLRECKKCGEILDDSRKALNLKVCEPTLFAEFKDEPLETGDSEADKSEDIVVDSTPSSATSSFSEGDFSPPVSDPLPTSGEQRTENLSEDISSGLGALGSMDKLQPRLEGKKELDVSSEIELESSTNEIDGLELTPSFNTDRDSIEAPPEEEDEFVLFADDDKPETGGQLKNDIPFEFSESDLESDISLSVPTDTTDKDLIELELDMEDDESLDQILADLETKDNSKKTGETDS